MSKESLLTKVGDPDEFAKLYGETADKDILFVVEAYEKWCGPTDAILSTVKTMVQDTYEGRKIKFFSACIEDLEVEEGGVMTKFLGTTKPHFLVFKNGDLVETIDGVNAPALKKAIADHIPEGMWDLEEEEPEVAATEEDEDY